MKKARIIFILAIVFSSCAYQPGIKLLNYKTNESVFFSGESGFYDEIVPTPIISKFVYSIYKENGYLKLDKRDLSGALLKDHQIPLFSEFYGKTPFALSQDENKLVYLKGFTKSIYLYNLLTKSESLLCGNLVSNNFLINGIFWMNNNTVIIILGEDLDIGRKNAEIMRIDVSTKEITAKLEIEDPLMMANYSFSPANMLLAIAPVYPRDNIGGIIIIDLVNMITIDEIPNSNQLAWMSQPAWNPAGTKLAYVYGNKNLSIYDMKNKISTEVIEIPKDNNCYFVAYPNESTCAIRYGHPDGKKKLYFIDLNTNKITRSISDVWGTAIFIDDGNVIAYEKH